jgi:transposase InsO family protein
VGHARAKLTVAGRQLLVARITAGYTIAKAAEAQGVSRTTATKWLRRYRTEGTAGLADRSSRPAHSPRRLDGAAEGAIIAARQASRYGPHRLAYLTGRPRSTCYAVLRRRGLSRLADADRVTAAPVRYVACHPGALLHQDHKKLGRIPDGGGHRALGRVDASQRRADRGHGYDHLEVFVDDASRLAHVVVVPDERPTATVHALEEALAWFAARGISIERVLTDNGANYRSLAYAAALERQVIRHKRTRPYRPQTNVKAERFIKTLINEWAYGRPYHSNQERLAALPDWLHFYNHERPHTALLGSTPYATSVNNVRGNHI